MRSNKLCLLLLSFLFFLLSSFFNRPALATESVQVTATVPYWWWLELTGWTSPFAQVELTMEQVIKRITTADDQGKFTFRIALPRTLTPFCLIATDVSNISSHPLCLAPPPPEFDILIKEVVMPPTLSLSKGKIAKGETVPAQGYTTPNSEVVPYLFEEKPRPVLPFVFGFYSNTTHGATLGGQARFRLPLITNYQLLITPALAAEVPKPKVLSDQNGFYQFNLPTEELGKNRVFVGSIFLNNPSPKSTTLVFDVLSWWRMLIEKIIAFLTNLFWWLVRFLTTPEGIIITEILIIAIIAYVMLRRETQKANRKWQN
ncbi:MAG: hypothetical protein ACOZBZ_04610 [Patescibacteria group bacterium]